MTLPGQQTIEPAKPVRWGEAGDDVRLIHILPDESAAIYVIEEPPGKKTFLYGGRKFSVFMPWVYFLIHVTREAISSDKKGAYILFSREKSVTLEEECLLIPFLPNLFKHGGICFNHTKELKTSRPMNTARLVIDWFWESDGNGIFCPTTKPAELGHVDYPYNAPFLEWEKKTEEEVAKIQWTVAKKRSIKEAVTKLAFNYWSRSFATVDDML